MPLGEQQLQAEQEQVVPIIAGCRFRIVEVLAADPHAMFDTEVGEHAANKQPPYVAPENAYNNSMQSFLRTASFVLCASDARLSKIASKRRASRDNGVARLW